MLRWAWARRWGVAIIAQMAGAAVTGYLTAPLSSAQIWLFRVAVAEAAAGTVAFIIVYSRMQGWRSRLGRTILVKSALLLAALTPALLSLFFIRLPLRAADAIDAGALASIGLVMAWRIRAWQHEAALPDDTTARLEALSAENERLKAENERLKADLGWT